MPPPPTTSNLTYFAVLWPLIKGKVTKFGSNSPTSTSDILHTRKSRAYANPYADSTGLDKQKISA